MANDLIEQNGNSFFQQVSFNVDRGFMSKLPKAIISNFEEVKDFVQAQTENDKYIIVTADNMDEAKARCAALNKQISVIDDQRKAVKKVWNTPYTDFEKKCKELTEIITTAKDALWTQITQADEAEKGEKEAALKAFYEGESGEIKEYRTWAQIFDKTWLNRGKKATAVQEEIKNIIAFASNDLTAIRAMKSPFETSLLVAYKDGKSLSEVLALSAKLQAQQEEVEKAKATRLAREAEEAAIKAQAAAIAKANSCEVVARLPETGIETDPVEVLDFRVYVTKTQKIALRDFLRDNDIRYGRVPVNE